MTNLLILVVILLVAIAVITGKLTLFVSYENGQIMGCFNERCEVINVKNNNGAKANDSQ